MLHLPQAEIVREIATGKTYEAVKAVTRQGTRKRWRIPWDNKTGWRYFEQKDIDAYLLRKQIESTPPEELHKRNNVEAAMFQYSFHTRNGKTRYRGLLKHRIHAYCRCMWMNLRRMVILFQRTIFAVFEAQGDVICNFCFATEHLTGRYMVDEILGFDKHKFSNFCKIGTF